MVKSVAVLALLAACALAGCNSLSSETEGPLASYLDNAAQYYEGGHYQRAYQQWDLALQIDPEDQHARLGQAMALYQLGRVEAPGAITPLTQATDRLQQLTNEDFGRDQWKVELGVGLAHVRWCDLYDRKIRKIAEDEKAGVAPDKVKLAEAKAEFARHLDIADRAFQSVLGGEEKAPRDRLTCWLSLAHVAYWRGDLAKSLDYANLYLKQVVSSETLWKNQQRDEPQAAEVYKGKFTGAQLQEADLRDLMGAVLFRLGRVDEAEKELSQVIKMFPQRATPYLNRGVIRQMRGDDDLARADLRRFLSLTDLRENDPSILEAARRLAEVEGRLAAQEIKDRDEPPPR
jgi:Tfp pilus assembly protein PilF